MRWMVAKGWPLMAMVLLFTAQPAAAQRCPQGIAHGTPGCIPPTNPQSPLYRGSSAEVEYRVRTTWGAIAEDAELNLVAGWLDARSEREASKRAIKECRDIGGINCKVALTFHDKCAVAVFGKNVAIYQSGFPIELVTEKAVSSCESSSSGCEVRVAGCAERVLVPR